MIADDGARASLRDLDSGAVTEVNCRYLIGRDGARSIVRKAMGVGIVRRCRHPARAVDLYSSAGLIDRQQSASAWGTGSIDPRRSGMVYAIDGSERWLVHNYMRPGEADFEAVDRDGCLRAILGVDDGFDYEIISKEDWYGRRLIAE